MTYFKSFFVRYWKDACIVLEIACVILCGIIIYKLYTKKYDCICDEEALNSALIISEKTDNNSNNICHIDIKGQVKNAGVYEISCDSNINDAITLAGGKTKSAYTNNINLSKTIKDEMVIYIYSKKEISDQIKESKSVETSECNCETIYINECTDIKASTITTGEDDTYSLDNNSSNSTSDSNTSESKTSLVNINSATKDELMTLSGIGESKAVSIIEYRTMTKFNTIEDIKNVSGIGDALYEKIKDYITV